ncbi:MAG TPA: oligopeptide ABC transporter permease [Longimicrobiales bacterium]|nr:oligopeptide ABC transporter permease [Longimicrobiales bacterium]
MGTPYDDRRANLPDPESAPTLPVPTGVEAGVPGDESSVASSEPVAPHVPRRALALSALLPGTGHALLGEWLRGITFLLPWGVLLALAWWAWERIVVARTGGMENHVALATLAGLMLILWGGALWDLSVRRRRVVSGGDSQWTIAARQFRRNRLAIAGLAIVIVLYLVALLAPLLAPYDPIAQHDIARTGYLSPRGEYLLGTDRFGRDVLSRIIYGARISLAIGFIATAISVTIGTLLGALAGYFGGRVDTLIMRFTDMVLAFPRLVLLIMIVALFGPSLTIIILVLGLTQWPGTTRIVRGDVLSLREREFVHAAHALGMSRGRIMLRHIIPNVLAPVIVTATLGIGNTIVMEAGLSFLGLGVQAPTPTWGSMVAEGRDNLLGAWWVATFPGLTIVLVVLAFNLVGDGLRDALDPRLRT